MTVYSAVCQFVLNLTRSIVNFILAGILPNFSRSIKYGFLESILSVKQCNKSTLMMLMILRMGAVLCVRIEFQAVYVYLGKFRLTWTISTNLRLRIIRV